MVIKYAMQLTVQQTSFCLFLVKTRLRAINKLDWNSIEILQWILVFFIPNNFIDKTKFNFEPYKNLTGGIVSKLKLEDFEKLDLAHGKSFYCQFMQFNTPEEIKLSNLFFLASINVYLRNLFSLHQLDNFFKRSNNAIKNLTKERLMIWLIKSFIPENSITLADFNFKLFSKFDGETLICKSAEEFQNIDPKYGKLLYDKLNELNSFCDDKTCTCHI